MRALWSPASIEGARPIASGLRSGDLIVVVDDEYIRNPEDIAETITDKRRVNASA